MANEKFNISIPITSGEIVIGREAMNYQRILDDFANAQTVRILTYNVSKNQNKNKLVDALKTIKEDADVIIISNIPSRMPYYYNSRSGESMKKNYQNSFAAYIQRLNPENFQSNPEVLFNFTNHAKIIGTENILYVGSANYSDESEGNIESGTIITDKEAIKSIYKEFFSSVIDESIPYYDDNFNDFRLFVLSMKAKFSKWLYWFENHLVWYNSETKSEGIRDYFELDEDELYELYSNIEELNMFIIHLENTYSEEDEAYNELINEILVSFRIINISEMEEFTHIDSDFYKFVAYSEEDRINELLQENPEAYDENLDYCAEEAMTEAHEEYFTMKYELENDIVNLKNQISMIVTFLESVHLDTLKYADIWIKNKLDNTN